MPTLTELFKTKQLPSQNGKTAEEAYDIQNSKDIQLSSANALVSATGLAGANLLRKTLGVRGSETLLEQELVGTRIIRGLSMPVIYGSELTRLILRTTPVLNTIKDNLNGNQPTAGPTDVAVGGGFFGAVPTPTYVVNALTKGKVKGKVKDSTINTGLIQNRINDLGLIKNSADGKDFGTFLKDINNGNLNNIGRQALGSVIKLGKEAIRKAILPGKTGKNRQTEGTVLKSNSLTGFTDESAKWWGVTSTNYGDNVDSKFEIPVAAPDKIFENDVDGTSYSKTINKEGDTPSERNDLSHKQKLDYEYLNEFRTSGGDVNPIRFSTAPERFKKFNPTGTDGTPYDADYKNKYIGTKRGMDEPSTDPIGNDGKNPSVNDKINLQTYWDETETKTPDIQNLDNMDFATLRFTSIPTKKSVQFRATISGLSETVSPSWDSAKFVGSPFSYYTYSGIERSITFNFKIFSLSIEEHKVAWEKLDFLTGLTYPAGYYDTSAVKPPFIKFTLGDMYKNKESFIESLSYTIDDNTPWEVEEKGYILPTIIDTSLTIKFVEARNNTKKFYSYTSTTQT